MKPSVISIEEALGWAEQSDGLQRRVEELKNSGASSAEEWNAIKCLEDAARLLFSAAAWASRDNDNRDGAR